MKQPLPSLSVALVGLLLSVAAVADDGESAQWLQKMARASQELDFDGTFIYEHEGHLQTMRIVHSAGKGGERERLVTLNGPFREIVRDQGKVICILPDDEKTRVEQSSTSTPFHLPAPDPDRLSPAYRFFIQGSERIAGRSSQILTIEPKDRFRYGQKVWLDVETGLLLKSQLLDEKGKVIEQLLFTSLKLYDKVPEHLLRPETQGKDRVWYRSGEEAEPFAPDPHWVVTGLPVGFEKEIQRKHYMARVDAPVEHMVFSDGLASLSVFIEPLKQMREKQLLGSFRMGAVNAHARVIKDHRITVVGEVPLVTVRRVAESVTYSSGADGD